MRNRPSEQSRDSRYPRQNTQSTEYRYVTKKLSEDPRNNDNKTTRRITTKTDSYFEYVPSVQSNQTQYLNSQVGNYKKPSLPYYVVPVLYVPQKVLSSEEIRPASAPLQNKRTVSFVVKNSEQSKKSNPESLDVDKIPCIPCEMKRKLGLKKSNYDSEEVFMNNVDLDQPYAGYINACYTPSSTSAIEDDCQPTSANYSQRKCNLQACTKCSDKVHEYRKPSKECNPQCYHNFIEQRRRCAGSQNKVELSNSVKADVRLRWNPEYGCYEKIDDASNISKKSSEHSEDYNRKKATNTRKDSIELDQNTSPEAPCQKKQASEVSAKPNFTEKYDRDKEYVDYDKNPECLDQNNTPETSCQRKQVTQVYAKRTQEEFARDDEYIKSEYERRRTFQEDFEEPEDYPLYVSYDDPNGFYTDNEEQRRFCDSQVSTLSCEKQSQLMGEVASLVGTSLMGTSPARGRIYEKTLLTEPLEDSLDDVTVLRATGKHRKRRRRPKESQTTFDDVVIYSTYVATDEIIRDSKSTQTVDPALANVSTGTQTDRVFRTFETCPPQHMERVRDDVVVSVKPRTREISPSPTRAKRNTSPVKQCIGDVKRGPVIRTVEITQKSSMNQSIQNYPQRKCKRKKVRAPWSPS